MDPCDDCAYVFAGLPRDAIPTTLRGYAERYAAQLAELDEDTLRGHPLTGSWSVLEYACHVRDIFVIQRTRIRLALTEWEPSFAPMRREERAIEERYGDQQPADVIRALHEAAAGLADQFDGLSDEGWQRRGDYNWPTPQLRTIEWIGRHTVHEAEHHWRDIERLIGAQARRTP